jgi:hypothetical protein
MLLDSVDEHLVNLIFIALDQGVGFLRDSKSPLLPFVVSEDNSGNRSVNRFVADRLEHAVEQALAYVKTAPQPLRVAAAYDGYVIIEGSRTDAVMVVGRDCNSTKTVLFAQRYAKPGFLRRFKTSGNAIFLESGPELKE